MAFSPYSALKANIALWLERTDLTSAIPDFVTLAEQHLNADSRLRVREGEIAATGMPDVNGVLTLPVDYHVMRAVLLNSIPYMETALITPGGSRALFTGSEGATAYSGHYTFYGGSIRTHPISTSHMTLVYYPKLALTNDSSTNWLLQKYPGAYLYGALVQAALYVRADERVSVWAGMYEDLLNKIAATDAQSRYAGAGGTIRGPTP